MSKIANMIAEMLLKDSLMFRYQVAMDSEGNFILRNIGNLSEPNSDRYAVIRITDNGAIIDNFSDTLKDMIKSGLLKLYHQMSAFNFILLAKYGKDFEILQNEIEDVQRPEGVTWREVNHHCDPFSPVMDAIFYKILDMGEMKINDEWVPFYIPIFQDVYSILKIEPNEWSAIVKEVNEVNHRANMMLHA